MKTTIAFVLGLVAAASLSIALHSSSDAAPAPIEHSVHQEVESAPEKPTLLEMVHHCSTELFPASKGVGGNALRFDAMSLRPHSRHFNSTGGIYELPEPTTEIWHVRVEEEHPHNSVPNGVEFAVNPTTGKCGHVIMD